MPTYIHHLSTNTGHSRRSPRGEVGDEVVALLAPMLTAALRGPVALPHPLTAWSMTAGAVGRCVQVTVWAPPTGGPPEPVVSIGIAARSRCAATLWETTTRQRPELARPDLTMPGAPWCVVRLEPALDRYPDAADWLGDFERCLAWAWLESPAGESDAS